MGLNQIYIIIPVHNRKQITLSCLQNLDKIGILRKFKIVVVDDGSIDGTSEAITKLYPAVIILHGNGNLWWTGAIKLGMKYAYSQGADYFIWLNDDTFPVAGAIELLINTCQKQPRKIVSAQCYASSDFTIPTYGSLRKEGKNWIPNYTISNEIMIGDAVSGNLVCLPRSIIKDIGYPPSNKFPHYNGDVIYTWQAKQAGYHLEALGASKAVCIPNNSEPSSWLLGDVSPWEHCKSFFSPKCYFYFPAYWHYCLTFSGWWGIIFFIRPYLQFLRAVILRCLFPKEILIDLRQKYHSILQSYHRLKQAISRLVQFNITRVIASVTLVK